MRKNILCDDIPPPPPGANAKPPELGPGMTTRESVEAITQMPGRSARAATASVINPLGFATEGFDALGRVPHGPAPVRRLRRRDRHEAGRHVGDPAGGRRRHDAHLGSPAELMSLMLASGKVEACLARNFFRFTYARWEDPTTDGCALEEARQALADGGRRHRPRGHGGEDARRSSGGRSNRRRRMTAANHRHLAAAGAAGHRRRRRWRCRCCRLCSAETAYGADPVFTRPPRLYWVTTDHGGAFESNMFPSPSLLTDQPGALLGSHRPLGRARARPRRGRIRSCRRCCARRRRPCRPRWWRR